MTTTYKVFITPKEVSEVATEAFAVGLHVTNGNLRYDLAAAIKNRHNRKTCIVMAYVDGKPVGIILGYINTRQINTYVRPAHRKCGIGQCLVKTFREATGLQKSLLIGEPGYLGWESFFKRNYIYVISYNFRLSEHPGKTIRQILTVVNKRPKQLMRKALINSYKQL